MNRWILRKYILKKKKNRKKTPVKDNYLDVHVLPPNSQTVVLWKNIISIIVKHDLRHIVLILPTHCQVWQVTISGLMLLLVDNNWLQQLNISLIFKNLGDFYSSLKIIFDGRLQNVVSLHADHNSKITNGVRFEWRDL